MKLVKPQLNFDELVKALGGQRALLGAKYGASSESVVIHDCQNAQYYGSLVVGLREMRMGEMQNSTVTSVSYGGGAGV